MGGQRLRGRSASVLDRRTLTHHIEACLQQDLTSLDEIVSHLRLNYREYSFKKEKAFATVVQNTLNGISSIPLHKRPMNSTDAKHKEHAEAASPTLNKRPKIMVETNNPTSSSFSSRNDIIASDDEDGSMSSPDLMKDILRASYREISQSSNFTTRSTPTNKKVELEIGGEKVLEKLNMVNIVNGPHRGGESSGTVVRVENFEARWSFTDDMEGARFKDFGGMKEVLEDLKDNVIHPIHYPELLKYLGVKTPTTGILLHGPPGCGKTRLAHAIANEAGVPLYKVDAPQLVSGVSGGSEENIRELFSKARRTAPSIIFIDEIDAIASKRETLQSGMEKRIVTQLMTCMDGVRGYVFIIAATNTPNALDPALRRPGRFDKEIAIPVPNENARAEILSVLTCDLRLESSFNLMEIARRTPGFVGTDLANLVKVASMLSFKNILDRKSELFTSSLGEEHADKYLRQPSLLEATDKLKITMADFEKAAKKVQPTLKRDGFSEVPTVKWEDVGGLNHLREKFEFDIVKAIKFPERYKRIGVKPQAGYLLYGPSGCGKTLIAKAVATEAGANFIYIRGPELLSKYVGDSEQAVRALFSRARTCSPCIIFFDEVDSLATKRGKEGAWVVERLLNQLLVELDGEAERSGIFVIGATNRPQVIDEALLRPGRFDELIYVPPPSLQDRGLILKALARKYPIDDTIDLIEIGKSGACNNFNGSDMALLMKRAGEAALRENESEVTGPAVSGIIKSTHFEEALRGISPSIGHEQLQNIVLWRERLKVA